MFSKLLFICVVVIPYNSGYCEDSGLYLLEPEHISMEYRDYKSYSLLIRNQDTASYRDPYLSPYDKGMTFGVAFNINYNLIRYKDFKLLYNNQLFFDSVKSHVRHAGWLFNLGANYKDKVEVGYSHMSRHILEDVRPTRFPVKDSLYLKFILFEK